jgi:hypothetical protein
MIVVILKLTGRERTQISQGLIPRKDIRGCGDIIITVCVTTGLYIFNFRAYPNSTPSEVPSSGPLDSLTIPKRSQA